MRRFPFLVIIVVLAGLAAPVWAELPPLIDRELFFGDPEISGAQLSPDGAYMSFIKPYQDVRNVYVKSLNEPFESARPITADDRPVLGYFWSQDSRYVLYVQDKDGNEDFHVYAVDPTAPIEPASGVPAARDLTPIEGVRAMIYALPEESPDVILIGLNDRDAAYHDVYRVSIASGDRELVVENTHKVGFWTFDLEGNLRLAYRQLDNGGYEILRVDGSDFVRIYDITHLESAFPIRFHKNGRQVYLETNKGDDVDLARLMLLDTSTGEVEFVESDPEKEVDFAEAVFNEATDELMATAYVGDRIRIYPKDDIAKRDLARIRKQLPEGNIGWGSSTEDMRYQIVSISSDVEAGATYLYDREANTFALQYRVRPQLASEHLAVMKPIRYKARDGLDIPAYLTLPRGVPAENLPTIIHPHGGPWSRDTWGYDPYAQFLANRGYAVLQPNFRGSSGYGKAFLNAGDKEWGIGAMQHDITDGVQWLIDQGIADPKRIGIFGGSYGGYATLAGVTFTPELYACGVPYVAPSNLVTLIESFPAYWRPFMKHWYLRVGDPEVDEDRADLEKRSPLFFADRIRVPLLVVHGANDPRVKQSESDRIVVALRDKGHPVEYIVAPDEGHGFRAPENRLALAASMEGFLHRHLGGRAQEDMLEPTAARLAEITRDVSAVTVAGAATAELAAHAKTAPLPQADGALIRPCSMQYAANLNMGANKMSMQTTRTIDEMSLDGRKCLRITDVTSMPMGEMTDAVYVDRKTLAGVSREATSPQGTLKLRQEPNRIHGEMGAGGQAMPVDIELEAPVMGDGAAFDMALAGLPLKADYEAPLRLFEPMTQKVRPLLLRVTGEETVAVAAGSYTTWVVSLEPLDDDPAGTATLHVMKKAPHYIVKGTYKLPAMMGGGTMDVELSKMTSDTEAAQR